MGVYGLRPQHFGHCIIVCATAKLCVWFASTLFRVAVNFRNTQPYQHCKLVSECNTVSRAQPSCSEHHSLHSFPRNTGHNTACPNSQTRKRKWGDAALSAEIHQTWHKKSKTELTRFHWETISLSNSRSLASLCCEVTTGVLYILTLDYRFLLRSGFILNMELTGQT